jgi:hypothetical protein
LFSLARRAFPGAEDPYALIAVGVRKNQNPPGVRDIRGYEAWLAPAQLREQ